MRMLSTEIAEMCHQANKVYCELIGDKSQVDWKDAPDWQKNSAIEGVHYHIYELNLGNEPTGENSHINWMESKIDEGWKYGAHKDVDAKTHPCILPYDQLPQAQKLKDSLFINIVKTFYEEENK